MSVEYYKGAATAHLAAGSAGAQGVAASSDLRLLGFSCKETAGAAAEFILRNGTDNTGAALAFVKLPANGCETEFLGQQGLSAPNGIYVDRISGSTELTVFYRE